MNDEEFVSSLPPRRETHNKKLKKKREKSQKKEAKKKSFARELVTTLFQVILLTGFFLVIQHFFFSLVTVEGESMEPTLHDNDRLVLSKVGDIERFDVVVFPAPDAPERQYIKRVIGFPGDEIEYRDDMLYLNGNEVEEPYLEFLNEEDNPSSYYMTGNFSLLTLQGVEEVPEDHYFVLGDNRVNSRDSRSFGFVPIESITGKTNLRIWPLEHFEWLREDITIAE